MIKNEKCLKEEGNEINIENSQFSILIDAISESDFYKQYTPELSAQHKLGHIQKVMLFSQIIAQNEKLNENQTKLLLVAAAFHDCGRRRDRNDKEHGMISAEIVGKYFNNNPDNLYGIKEDEIGIIQVTIAYHVISESTLGRIDEVKLKELCYYYNVNIGYFEDIKKISAILKDADALDRTRFVSGSSLKKEMLRTETAKQDFMILISKMVNQEYAKAVLNEIYMLNQYDYKDSIKALQNIRNYYRDKNGGMYRREKDLPISMVKLMFKWILENERDNICISSNYKIEKVFIGNTGDMYYVLDGENHKQYYFKPAISKRGVSCPYKAYVQESAYIIQKIINPECAVKCCVTEINGMFGAIQEKINVDYEATNNFCNYLKNGQGVLSDKIIEQILDEYLVDFCLCNYDSTFRNFIIDTEGRVRGIDKEQSFRYINEDVNEDMFFSVNYNKKYGASSPIYNLIFEKMKKAEISNIFLEKLKYRAMRLSIYPDEKYRKIFEMYAYEKEKKPENAEILLDKIVDRKKYILHKIDRLQNNIYKERLKNTQELYLEL